MYWNDHKTAISSKPIKKTVVNSSKVFASEGNPQMGQPATILTGDFVNTVQEELINVVEKAGLTPNKNDDTQLYQAIKAISNSGIPKPLGDKGSVLTVVDKEKEIVAWKNLSVVKVVQGNVDIYVATTGDDKTGDGSKDNPFKTIQKAVYESYKYMPDNGHNIHIRIATGTYHETVIIDGKKQQAVLVFFYEEGVVIRAQEDKYVNYAMIIKNGAIVEHYGTPSFHSTSTNLGSSPVLGALLVHDHSSCFFFNGLNINLAAMLWALTVSRSSVLYIIGHLNIVYAKNTEHVCAIYITKNCYLELQGFSGTIHGNPRYILGTLRSESFSMCTLNVTSSFTGNVTGRRFHLSELSFVHSFGKGANFLPGSAAGEAYHGSQYI